eukprot:jgi/Hompol1/1711/HPOL_005696-RA
MASIQWFHAAFASAQVYSKPTPNDAMAIKESVTETIAKQEALSTNDPAQLAVGKTDKEPYEDIIDTIPDDVHATKLQRPRFQRVEFDVLSPIETFPPSLAANLHAMNIDRPTPIQAKAFASIREGRNTIITAETGSGKSLAYLIPIIDRLLSQNTPKSSPGTISP